MRTTQAARYARWAAAIAIVLVVFVAGVYARRALREARARRAAPPPVPPTVQQQSAGFSFSKVEQDRTLFTVRASRATQFKEQDRSVLEDVSITIFGRDGDRNDTIRTHACNYEPAKGNIVCQGDVAVDLESAQDARHTPGQRVVHLATRDITFDRETGEVFTAAPAEFRFPNGEGRGVGIRYNTQTAGMQLEHDVELKLSQPNHSDAEPLVVTGSRMEYARSRNVMHVSGPARAQQGQVELVAQNLALELDAELHARRAVATGAPEFHAAGSSGQTTVAAEQFVALFRRDGSVERVLANGGIRGDRRNPAGEDHFSAQQAEFQMTPPGPESNQPQEMTATGDVKIGSQQRAESREIETAALRLKFAPQATVRGRRIASGETLAPGTIVTKSQDEAVRIHAKRFTAQFDELGRLQKLLGHSGVEMQRQLGAGAPQVTTSREMVATFSGSEWASVEETGSVKFRQGDRTAQAGHALIIQANDAIMLDGSPVVADAVSRTTASSFQINQRTGDVHAAGGVRTTYFAAGQSSGPGLGTGPAHVSADSLAGNSATGRAVYSGRARLWQGDSVVQAKEIELLRNPQRMDARGNVVALIPQAPDPKQKTAEPTVWEVHAPQLTYWGEEGRAHLEEGVSAESRQGELLSRTLDMYLATQNGRRQLEHSVALGGVVVQQGDRRGTAERGDYTAADGKFVLSGGQPTLSDASRDTTQGRSLTFWVANDTILVDSEAGTRTLTKHQVEK